MTIVPTLRIWASSRGLGVCRGCKASIEWAEIVESGRKLPFDRIVVLEQLVDADSDRAIQVIDRTFNHWATCPESQSFRRRR